MSADHRFGSLSKIKGQTHVFDHALLALFKKHLG